MNWTEETAIYSLTYLEELPETDRNDDPEKSGPSKELEVIEGEVEEIAPPPFYKRPIPRTWGLLLCFCLLGVSTIVATLFLLFFTATATIEIILIKRPISFQQTVTVSA